jgi:hypothetical protein
MELIPLGHRLSAQVETLLHGGQGAAFGLLVSILIPDHPLELVAEQFADRSGFASRQEPRLSDHILIQAEGDVLFRHVPISGNNDHVKYV